MARLSLYKRRHQRSVPLGFKAILDYIFWVAHAADCFLLLFFLCLGKYYYEVTCHDQGLCRVGWSTSQAALDLGMFSHCSTLQYKYSSTEQLCHFLYVYFFPGTDKYGFGFGGTGKKSNNKQFDSYGEVMFNEIMCHFYLQTTVKIT